MVYWTNNTYLKDYCRFQPWHNTKHEHLSLFKTPIADTLSFNHVHRRQLSDLHSTLPVQSTHRPSERKSQAQLQDRPNNSQQGAKHTSCGHRSSNFRITRLLRNAMELWPLELRNRAVAIRRILGAGIHFKLNFTPITNPRMSSCSCRLCCGM